MVQLSLRMPGRLGYSPENFVLHSGVGEQVRRIEEAAGHDFFEIVHITGNERQGKTHLSIKLAELVSRKGLHLRLLEGSEIEEWSARQSNFSSLSEKDVFIIDNIQEYFLSLTPGLSGSFVSLVEALRVQNGTMVLISSVSPDMYPCDEHVMSRLNAGTFLEMGEPSDEELPVIIDMMAKQRGIFLSPKKISFLQKRLGRAISSIESYLEKVKLCSDTLGTPIDLSLISRML